MGQLVGNPEADVFFASAKNAVSSDVYATARGSAIKYGDRLIVWELPISDADRDQLEDTVRLLHAYGATIVNAEELYEYLSTVSNTDWAWLREANGTYQSLEGLRYVGSKQDFKAFPNDTLIVPDSSNMYLEFADGSRKVLVPGEGLIVPPESPWKVALGSNSNATTNTAIRILRTYPDEDGLHFKYEFAPADVESSTLLDIVHEVGVQGMGRTRDIGQWLAYSAMDVIGRVFQPRFDWDIGRDMKRDPRTYRRGFFDPHSTWKHK